MPVLSVLWQISIPIKEETDFKNQKYWIALFLICPLLNKVIIVKMTSIQVILFIPERLNWIEPGCFIGRQNSKYNPDKH